MLGKPSEESCTKAEHVSFLRNTRRRKLRAPKPGVFSLGLCKLQEQIPAHGVALRRGDGCI